MDKLVLSIVVTIILIGIAFYVFNSEIGPGLTNGGDHLQQKIEDATS
ncbi:hypothetical protein [Paenibacillus gansuensis]|uniref:Uncharacterized protein n=1 Tax=Paenibacillus gansuensis TaxID=306542 RepID=A0ABW5PEJ4_9BACL